MKQHGSKQGTKQCWCEDTRGLTLFPQGKFPSSISPAIIPQSHTKHVSIMKLAYHVWLNLPKHHAYASSFQRSSLLTVLISLLNQQTNSKGPYSVHSPLLHCFLCNAVERSLTITDHCSTSCHCLLGVDSENKKSSFEQRNWYFGVSEWWCWSVRLIHFATSPFFMRRCLPSVLTDFTFFDYIWYLKNIFFHSPGSSVTVQSLLTCI